MNFPIPPAKRIGIVAWRCSRAHATRNCASPIPVWCWALIRETRQGRDHREEYLCVCARVEEKNTIHIIATFDSGIVCCVLSQPRAYASILNPPPLQSARRQTRKRQRQAPSQLHPSAAGWVLRRQATRVTPPVWSGLPFGLPLVVSSSNRLDRSHTPLSYIYLTRHAVSQARGRQDLCRPSHRGCALLHQPPRP
jgi:hypothetical protein